MFMFSVDGENLIVNSNKRAEFIIIGRLDERGQFLREFEPQFSTPVVAKLVQNNDNPNNSDPNKATKVLPDVVSPPTKIEPEPIVTVVKPVKKSHYAVGDVIEVASIFYLSVVNDFFPIGLFSSSFSFFNYSAFLLVSVFCMSSFISSI